MDAIAEAAGVSRRTLFHYFSAKEDVLFANHEKFVASVVNDIRKGPKGESWPSLVERAIVQAIVDTASSESFAIDALARCTRLLQSRYQLKYVHLEEAIAGALQERGDGNRAAYKRSHLLAALVAAGLRLSTGNSGDVMLNGSYNSERGILQEFRAFWRSLSEFGEQGLAHAVNRKMDAARAKSISVKRIGGSR